MKSASFSSGVWKAAKTPCWMRRGREESGGLTTRMASQALRQRPAQHQSASPLAKHEGAQRSGSSAEDAGDFRRVCGSTHGQLHGGGVLRTSAPTKLCRTLQHIGVRLFALPSCVVGFANSYQKFFPCKRALLCSTASWARFHISGGRQRRLYHSGQRCMASVSPGRGGTGYAFAGWFTPIHQHEKTKSKAGDISWLWSSRSPSRQR